MKYPVIYIKGRGNHTARFTELTEGQMRIAGDIGAAMGKLRPLKDDHAFILYEQQGEEDIRSIRFLRSWFPGAGIILIISGQLTGEERRAYLGAGVNSAVPGDISRADFLRILQFMTDYTFVHKPVAGSGNDVELFRMPLWKRAFDIAASLSAILLLSPLLIAVAVAVRLDSPGPVIYKSKRVGSNYRIFDFLKFRSMRSDADQRLKELEDLNQYASEPVAEDDAKMALNDDEIRKLLADTENGMLYADDFVIPEEAHHHQLETEQENAFVKIENDPRITRLGRFLRKYSIDCFIYIGGNDSMDTVDKLSKYLNDKGITDITVVGAPKTIDNDLCGTDHCPGFGSAAKYIGTTFAELERDCHVYTTKAVTIVEVMGRDAGWLTAASCLARANGAKGPDFIYLCEVPFSIDTFLKDVKAKLEEQDAVIIAVSEGVKSKDGRYISEEVQSSAVDSFGHSYIAGAAKVLEDAVRNEIGCKVRSIELNLMQRCAAHLASATDIQESRMLGKAACQYALEGAGGMMAAVIRTSDKPYATEFKALPVCDIANAIKSVPADYINDAGNDVTEKMVDYLTPLIQGEMNTVYENGIPKYIYLY